MIAALRRSLRLSLLALACISGASAAASGIQIAFLRAAPQAPAQPPASARAPAASAAQEASPARQSLGPDFYDPTNPDLRHLQRHDEAMAGIAKDANGFPDWMRALKSGAIAPRTGLAPNAGMNVFDLDIVMKNTKEMPWVRFPHSSHTMWLDCSNCHPAPFEPRAGSTPITMAEIFRGKYCGICHDRVAFITFFSCQRCHSEPQTATAPAKR